MTPEERRKRKLALASEPDSIFFLVTYGGKSSSFMVRHLMDADRIIHLLRGRLGFSLTIEQVNEAVARYEKLLEAAWDYVYKFIPRLALVKPSSWRQLNDTPSEKAVLAGRFGSVAFLPRSEESGQLAMAVKLLNVRGLELRQTGKLDEIEQLASSYKDFMSALENVNKEISEVLGIQRGAIQKVMQKQQHSKGVGDG